jgi:hypothetical protein
LRPLPSGWGLLDLLRPLCSFSSSDMFLEPFCWNRANSEVLRAPYILAYILYTCIHAYLHTRSSRRRRKMNT